jgi:AP2 domain/HNH endonuclease
MPSTFAIRGFTVTVDDEDLIRVVQAGPWFVYIRSGKTVYVRRNIRRPDGTWGTETLHRFILGITDPKIFVDHINRKGLDNRKSNLRVCTRSQNAANGKKRTAWSASSPLRGVTWHKRARKWHAQIGVNGKRRHLGYFADEIAAARAYDAAAREYFGAFARCNFK